MVRVLGLLAAVVSHITILFILKWVASTPLYEKSHALTLNSIVIRLEESPRLEIPKLLELNVAKRDRQVNSPGAPFNSQSLNSDVAHIQESTVANSAPSPLNLQVPKVSDFHESESAVQQALIDPRSNSVKLTVGEKFAIAVGSFSCVYVERLSDGTIVRAPGRIVKQPDPDTSSTRTLKVCVKKLD